MRIAFGFTLLFLVFAFSENIFAQSGCQPDPRALANLESECNQYPDCGAILVGPEAVGGGYYFMYCQYTNPACAEYGNGNYLFGGPQCAGPIINPNGPKPKPPPPPSQIPQCASGSIIQVDNHVLGESVPIVGTSFNLTYFTNRTVGRKSDYRTPIALAQPTSTVTSIEVQIDDPFANTVQDTTFPNMPGLTDIFIWNGLGPDGLPTWGTEQFSVEVLVNSTAGNTYTDSTVNLGNFKAKNVGLGGWVPDVYNFLDVGSGNLYNGNGIVRQVSPITLANGNLQVAEQDGFLVYVFSASGRHLSTQLGVTGAVIYSFNYNSTGQLSSIIEPGPLTTTFNFDSNGNFTSITSPYGAVTKVSLDANGYLASIANPRGDTYSMTYIDAGGLLATFQKPTGLVSVFSYDSIGNLMTDQNNGGALAALSPYDSSDPSVTTLTSRLGRNTVVSDDTTVTTQMRTTDFSSGLETTLSVAQNSQTYNDGFVNYQTTWANDPRFGSSAQQITQTAGDPSGASRLTNISDNITLADSTNPFSIQAWVESLQTSAGTTTTNYNGATKTYSRVTPVGRTSQTTINNLQKPTQIVVGNLTPITLTYDTQGRLISTTQGSRTNLLNFDANSGLMSSSVDPLGRITSYGFDAAQNLTSQTLPDGRVVRFTFDGVGNLTSVTPPSRPAHNFVYGINELLAAYNPPSLVGVPNVSTTYSYNFDKQLTNINRPDGSQIVYSYDPTSGLLTGLTTPEGAFSNIQYDASGRMSTMKTPAGVNSIFNYTAANLSFISTQPPSATTPLLYTKTFDPVLGHVANDSASFGSQSISVNYGFDNDEVLTGAGALNINYSTPNGLLSGSTLGSVSDSFSYDTFGAPLSYIAVKNSSTSIYNLSMTRDNLGRIATKTETLADLDHFEHFGFDCDDNDFRIDRYGFCDAHDSRLRTVNFKYIYDIAGRLSEVHNLTTVEVPGYGRGAKPVEKTIDTLVSKYEYDPNSNRIGGFQHGRRIDATYDNEDRLLTYGVFKYSYTANGDLATKTNTLTREKTQYSFDAFGNLRSVTMPDHTVITYEVDSQNHRVGRAVNGQVRERYIFNDQAQLVADVDSKGNLRRYVYGTRKNTPDYFILKSVNYKIISDQLGSPREVINTSTGQIVLEMVHDEFGRIVRETKPGFLPFGFAGGFYDHRTGLLRFGAREYDPEVGRWLQRDPILFQGGDSNLYGYVLQDPINNVDINGHGLTGQQVAQGITIIFNGLSGAAGICTAVPDLCAGWLTTIFGPKPPPPPPLFPLPPTNCNPLLQTCAPQTPPVCSQGAH